MDITKEEIINYLIRNARKKQEETGMATVLTPFEQAQQQQEKRAKERHKYLLQDYKV